MATIDDDYYDRLCLPDDYDREDALRPKSPKEFHEQFTAAEIDAVCTAFGTLLRKTQCSMALLPLAFVAREADDFDGIRVRFDADAFRRFIGDRRAHPRTADEVCDDWTKQIRAMLHAGYLPLGVVASDAYRMIEVHAVEYLLNRAMVSQQQFDAAVATALRELVTAHPEAAHLLPPRDADPFVTIN
jgi:hypothetical protein